MNTTPWIEVPEDLLREAAKELSAPLVDKQAHLTADVPKSLVEGLIEYFGEDLLDDHSVGICTCGLIGLVEELKLALEGKQTCRNCGGEGFVWDEEQCKREITRLAQEKGWTENETLDVYGDWPGNKTCPACNGNGTVNIREEKQ